MAEPKDKPEKRKIPTRETHKRTGSGIFDNVRQLPHPAEEFLGLTGQDVEPEHTVPLIPIQNHPTTQPPNHQSQIEWSATQPEPGNEKPSTDFRRMPSRWNKADKTFRIDAQLAEKFKTRSAIEKWGMSEVIEDLIRAFMTGMPPNHPTTHAWFLKVKDMAGQPHHDDMMMGGKGALNQPSSNNQLVGQPANQPEDELLAFYTRWTRNQISDYDRARREEVRHVPVDICKVAILTAFYRAKRKINSFNYFVEEIKATFDEFPEMNTSEYFSYQLYAIGRDKGRERVPEEDRPKFDEMARRRGK